ncbi:MAG: sialate O-acetylesterase [Kiritimatiellales bacterium]
MTRKVCLFLLTALFSAVGFAAQLTLPTVFTDHMVLQREKPVPIWGTTDPNTAVTVEFAGQKKSTTAATDGKWRVDLEPMKASSEPQIMTVSAGDQTVRIQDVLIGEVWLCSGQSNMQMPLKGFKIPTDKAAQDIPAANIPLLRLYNTPRVAAGTPKDRIDSSWTACTPGTAAEFSAAAFYFGRKLQKDLNVPIGLLESAWGGTRIEPWTPPSGFEGIDSLAAIRQQIKNISPNLGTNPKTLQRERQTPTALYNGMLAAHIPFAIRGAIWYQGEANHGEGMLYVDKTKALLKGWRGLWGDDFPYYFVQIAPFQYGNEDPTVLPTFWEAQAEIVKQIPKTGMAVITDCALLNDIHPTDKETPGIRLALLAEENTYGMNVVSTGPTFEKMKIDGDKIIVTFTSAEGLTTRDDKAPDWFEIGGEEGVFKPAKAEIKGTSVILSSPDVPQPLAMRFGWNKLAEPNLMNGAGLPAPAFRAGELPKPKAPDMVEIPEMKGYRTVYQLMIDANANYAYTAPDYDIDNSSDKAPFTKVAYLLELQKPNGSVDYAFATMDTFTTDLKKIGVPTAQSGAKFMQKVDSLTVRSNVKGIIACTDSDGGNIEFWPGNYGGANEKNIPGAEAKYDFGDQPTDKIPGYGSMQVHNWKDKQTVFAINKWGTGGTVDIGIGNSTGKTSDWTFTGTAGTYLTRRLTVLVK